MLCCVNAKKLIAQDANLWWAQVTDVFVSYKREDRPRAEHVVRALTDQGFSVWWDENITPREAWDATIERQISGATSVLVLWSQLSVASDWVRTEAHFAHDRNKLIPVKVETCALPLAFALVQTVDLTDWGGQQDHRQWRKLLSWISDLTASRTNTDAIIASGATNKYREIVGHLPSGEAISDGALINAATPAGTLFKDGADGCVMRCLPRGEFMLGAPPTDIDRTPAESPQKRIQITQPLAMGIYPVLTREFGIFIQSPPQAPSPNKVLSWLDKPVTPEAPRAPATPRTPVTHVSFNDAVNFALALSEATGYAYRLPSETEWEFACRSMASTRYSHGNVIDASHAVFHCESTPLRSGPAEAGQYAHNRFGLFDMHGNVREWTMDGWHDSHEFTPADGSPAPQGQSSMRVVRGGAWCDPAPMLRSSWRGRATYSTRDAAIGFRIVRELS